MNLNRIRQWKQVQNAMKTQEKDTTNMEQRNISMCHEKIHDKQTQMMCMGRTKRRPNKWGMHKMQEITNNMAPAYMKIIKIQKIHESYTMKMTPNSKIT